jgi:hypothetical protein
VRDKAEHWSVKFRHQDVAYHLSSSRLLVLDVVDVRLFVAHKQVTLPMLMGDIDTSTCINICLIGDL